LPPVRPPCLLKVWRIDVSYGSADLAKRCRAPGCAERQIAHKPVTQRRRLWGGSGYFPFAPHHRPSSRGSAAPCGEASSQPESGNSCSSLRSFADSVRIVDRAPFPLSDRHWGASNPTQGRRDDICRAAGRALAMGDQEALRFPFEHRSTCDARSLVGKETQAPVAWGAAIRSHKTTQPHDPPFPAGGVRFGKALDQVTEYGSPRRAVKEHHFLHSKRSTKYRLIDVAFPRTVRLIAEFSIEVKLLRSPGKTWRCVEARIRPAMPPLRQKKVM
jgi:hypothetical protein